MKLDLTRIHSIYFLGIGGIGMSAQARYFRNRGIQVAGYDKNKTSLTDLLTGEGVPVHFTENIGMIPSDPDLVIYTPAIPPDNTEFVYLMEKGYPMLKRSEVLGELTKDIYTIAVAGTHGKTTITSMITHILKTAGIRVTSFIGGISRNYGSNLVDDPNPEIMIVEADEYDRSFLSLRPDIIIISAMDADHLDVYGSQDQMIASYKEFAAQVRENGHLVINHAIRNHFPLNITCSTVSASCPEASFFASGIRLTGGKQFLDIHLPDKQYANLQVGVPGRFNVENAVTAVAAASLAGIQEKDIRHSLATFRGVERRFDCRVISDAVVYIDDYAHHPREISACIQAARDLFPGKKITGIFQPHLYTRTRDLAGDFAISLSQLDELILLEIYSAREKPIKGISSEMLLQRIQLKHKCLCSLDELLQVLSHQQIEVLLSLGAGDIGERVSSIEKWMKETYEVR
ncbi:MAG: UDP-N-acetylmuramate--L-alanine ligase [Bacteroidales bacterium]|nr:UDP-N-acetylmuramate--L-alanine ligase [Lentimicrobiaceae bacterium]MDD5695149.1 UDP-N-acetylmuramate--L-alanine ligase [Bacteroidales bacterium]